MENIEIVLRILLVVVAVALIGLVMIQQGKGASMGAAFGSGASQTVFGSSGATGFLTKLTTWLAIGFFVITFGLAWVAKEKAAAAGDIGLPSAPTPMEMPATEAAPRATIEVGDGDVPMTIEVTPAADQTGTDDVPVLEIEPAAEDAAAEAVEDMPVEDMPVEDVPVEDVPVQDVPGQDVPES